MQVTIYDTLSGEIKFSADLSAAEIAENVAEGEGYIEGYFDGRTKLIQNGSAVDRPINFDAVEFARSFRQGFLIESDWTQTVDAPLTASKKAEWATYRQALRDFPATIQAELANGALNRSDVEELIPLPPE